MLKDPQLFTENWKAAYSPHLAALPSHYCNDSVFFFFLNPHLQLHPERDCFSFLGYLNSKCRTESGCYIIFSLSRPKDPEICSKSGCWHPCSYSALSKLCRELCPSEGNLKDSSTLCPSWPLCSCWLVDCLLTRVNTVETTTVMQDWIMCGKVS